MAQAPVTQRKFMRWAHTFALGWRESPRAGTPALALRVATDGPPKTRQRQRPPRNQLYFNCRIKASRAGMLTVGPAGAAAFSGQSEATGLTGP